MVLQRQDVLGPQSLAELCSLASLRIPETRRKIHVILHATRGSNVSKNIEQSGGINNLLAVSALQTKLYNLHHLHWIKRINAIFLQICTYYNSLYIQ